VKALILCAGFGTRLGDLSKNWPKCLMPIKGRPLLEYWLYYLKNAGISNVLLNSHFQSHIIEGFLKRRCFNNMVELVYEKDLLGTAGTLIHNAHYFINERVLLAHGDNWTNIDLKPFIDFHLKKRNKISLITMMVFETTNPTNCGIVETNQEGLVVAFHEKVKNPPNNNANAAIYIIEPEVIKWLIERPWIRDFSTEVIPAFLGKIDTWMNPNQLIDIGTPEMLKLVQNETVPVLNWDDKDEWSTNFLNNKIHHQIKNI
jgi:mannose-1-phosphate guanylyltransferase